MNEKGFFNFIINGEEKAQYFVLCLGNNEITPYHLKGVFSHLLIKSCDTRIVNH